MGRVSIAQLLFLSVLAPSRRTYLRERLIGRTKIGEIKGGGGEGTHQTQLSLAKEQIHCRQERVCMNALKGTRVKVQGPEQAGPAVGTGAIARDYRNRR